MFNFDAKLSAASLSPADQHDLEKIYNVYSYEDLCSEFPTVDINAVYEKVGYQPTDTVIVGDVGLMECVSGLLTEENLDMLKLYLKVGLVKYSAGMFGEDFREATITYTQELFGISGSTRWRPSRRPGSPDYLYDYVGEAYAEKYCTEQMKGRYY